MTRKALRSVGDDTEAVEAITGVIEVPVVSNTDTSRAPRVPTATRLVCVSGTDMGRAFPIGPAPIVVGRGKVDLALKASDVSRKHARITWRDDAFVIEDLGSANGTFVNGVPVGKPTPLSVGDRVQIGATTIFVFTHHDQLEARMRNLQQLEAMERLVGGLASDFNDAFMVILSSLATLEETVPADEDAREALEDLRTAATGASTLARRLLDFQRRETGSTDAVPIGALVEDAVAVIRHGLPSGVVVSVAADARAVVRGAREELLQAISQLLASARDAMPGRGTMSVIARIVRFEIGEAVAHHLGGEGEYVELSVIDTGPGLDESAQARAFEPLFTTKTGGLSLAMVHSVVRRHHGAVELDSSPGRGTTVRVWLPRA